MMNRLRAFRFTVAVTLAGCAAAAPAKTVIIFVDPMTLEKHAHVVDTPGQDRFLMCMQPPAVSGCRELAPRKRP